MSKEKKSQILSVSSEGRKAFDTSYQTIRQQSEARYKKKRFKQWGIGVGVIAVVTFMLLATPVGMAVGRLLGFDKFESETLKDNGFITAQNTSSTDQEITITLVELYSDNNELGFHLQATLPKQHPLLNKNLNAPNMSFRLIDKKGEEIGREGQELSMKKWGQLDVETRTLDFYSSINSQQNEVDLMTLLEDGTLEVYRIGAIYEHQKENLKPGFHELQGESVEGKWLLPIDTSQLTKFETLTYQPIDSLNQGVELLISPTQGVVQLSADSLEKSLPELDAYLREGKEPELIAFKGEVSKELTYEGSSTLAANNYRQLIFDFGGYDAYDRFELQIDSQVIVEFTAKQ